MDTRFVWCHHHYYYHHDMLMIWRWLVIERHTEGDRGGSIYWDGEWGLKENRAGWILRDMANDKAITQKSPDWTMTGRVVV